MNLYNHLILLIEQYYKPIITLQLHLICKMLLGNNQILNVTKRDNNVLLYAIRQYNVSMHGYLHIPGICRQVAFTRQYLT